MEKQTGTKDNGDIIRFENITKRFGGVTALNDVSFGIRPGEVHAVVGENGAGKTTLVKLLAGVEQQDSGRIIINGEEIQIASPRIAEQLGISMVFQELNLFLPLTVAANIFIRQEVKTGGFFLNEAEMHHRSKEVLDTLMGDIDSRTKIEELSVGQRQTVEIARALYRGTSVIIMDEPNSALTDRETQALFEIIRQLEGQGITVLYVSHRLEEVFTIADRITVLRDGRYMGTWDRKETTVEEIVSKVVGRRLGEIFPQRPPLPEGQAVTLSVTGMTLGDNIEPVEFQARRGEVLGFAGLAGSGVQEIFSKLFGLEKQDGSEIRFHGELQAKLSPTKLIDRGWAFIPANRRDEGLMLDWPIRKNISLVIIRRLLNRLGLIDYARERARTETYAERLNIITDSLDKRVNTLSGGNQQKVVLAKWLASEPKVLILNDPTRGIDVGTKHEIYQLVNGWAQQGFTILFTSSEIEEILGLCDRILVLYKGRIIREFQTNQTDKAEVMRHVLGGDVANGNATIAANDIARAN